MTLSLADQLFLGWLGLTCVWTFVLFGYDKWQAGRNRGRRIAEATLILASAVGGWPGGLLGLILFRHKSAKPSFQLKFAGAFFVWVFLVAGVLKLTGRL